MSITFLTIPMLWGLLAVSLPLLIHLLNRLRFRSVPWAAMMFLVSATRSSTKRAKLRHYLILLCRSLIIALFILALARPVVGGWFGATLARSPETVLILLDRSASMELTDTRRRVSKRQHALNLFGQVAAESVGSSRFVLIENVMKAPQEVPSLASLGTLANASATDTAADIPAMMQAALEYMIRNRTGRTEIWIASDLQQSNWRPQSRQWGNIAAQIAALPVDTTVRLLALSGRAHREVSVALRDAKRLRGDKHDNEHLALELVKLTADAPSFPMSIDFDDGLSVHESFDMTEDILRYNRTIGLAPGRVSGGWGKAELPADDNLRGNVCYFTYPGDTEFKAALVAESISVARYLSVAVAPSPDVVNSKCRLVAQDMAKSIPWNDTSLLIWQGVAPDTATADGVRAFVESGGAAIFFPSRTARVASPDASGSNLFGLAWGPIENADKSAAFTIATWDENDGPLADTADGRHLPLAGLEFSRRRAVIDRDAANTGPAGKWSEIAHFEDGKPFLLRKQQGDGVVYACASLPARDWSNLGYGTSDSGPRVMVPMMQRLLWRGAMRLVLNATAVCGEWQPGSKEEWITVQAEDAGDYRWHAGIYRCGMRTIALNRPVREDAAAFLSGDKASELFGDVNVQVLEDLAKRSTDKLQSEIWDIFLTLALIFVIVETSLLLSDRTTRRREGKATLATGA